VPAIKGDVRIYIFRVASVIAVDHLNPNINRGTYVPTTVWHTMSARGGLRGEAAALRARGKAASCRGKAAYNLVCK